MASSYSSRATSAFPAAVGTASGKGSRDGPGGTFWARTLGNKEITMLRRLQEGLFELGLVSWVASQLRAMNQSSRRNQPERRRG